MRKPKNLASQLSLCMLREISSNLYLNLRSELTYDLDSKVSYELFSKIDLYTDTQLYSKLVSSLKEDIKKENI